MSLVRFCINISLPLAWQSCHHLWVKLPLTGCWNYHWHGKVVQVPLLGNGIDIWLLCVRSARFAFVPKTRWTLWARFWSLPANMWSCLAQRLSSRVNDDCNYGRWCLVRTGSFIGGKVENPKTYGLTHWGRDKMDAIFQTPFSNGFLNENVWISIKILLKLFQRVQLTIFQHSLV